MNYVKSIDLPEDISGDATNDLFKQYERVIVESIITSFGLDFLINDQYGGDVDTVHNVRQIGNDKGKEKMVYKNEANKAIYDQMPDYSSKIHDDWHKKGENFRKTKHDARETFNATGKTITDEYTGKQIGFYGHTKAISAEKKAELDHILSTKSVYDDRGRVLAGLDGKELADDKSNFAWTNKSLNASLGAKSNTEYANDPENKDKIDEFTKENLINKEEDARKSYDRKIEKAYYTSKAFMKDTGKAAAKQGFKMGLRQALGFVFSEIWFSVRDEIKVCKDEKSLFKKVADGIKKGLASAKKKYDVLWQKFVDGAVAGAMSSLITTLCNIFFSTAKSVVKIIRQTWASLVEAVKILVFNPDSLPLGEQLRAAAKIIATAASIVAGTLIADLIEDSAIGAIPVIGEIVSTFIGSFVTGILSCTLLYFMDHSSLINKAVEMLNSLPSRFNTKAQLKQQAQQFEKYCAELKKIDFDTFLHEVNIFTSATSALEKCETEKQLNTELEKIYRNLNLRPAWQGDFNEFMSNPNNKLVFR